VTTSNVKLCSNILAIELENSDKSKLVRQTNPADYAFRLSYFELLLLHRAAPLLYSSSLFQRENLTDQQLEELKAYLRVGSSLMWPEADRFRPLPLTRARNPFLDSGAETVADEEEQEPISEVREDHAVGEEDDGLPVVADEEEQEPIEQASADYSDGVGEFVLPTVPDEDEQNLFIHAPAGQSQLVFAPPGTGKTYALIRRLGQIAAFQTGDPHISSCVVLSFSRATVRELRGRIADYQEESDLDLLMYVQTRTFDSFVTRVLLRDFTHDELVLRQRRLGLRLSSENFDGRIRLFNHLISGSELVEGARELDRIDHLFVDEIQDLTGPRADLVLALVTRVRQNGGSVTVLGDPGQAIYDFNVQPGELNSQQFLHQVQASIAKTVAQRRFTTFRRYSNDRLEQFVKHAAKSIGSYGDEVNLVEFRKLLMNQSRKKLRDLPSDLTSKETLTILARSNKETHEIAAWCRENEIPVTVNRGRDTPWDRWYGIIFSHWSGNRMGIDRFRRRWNERIGDGQSQENLTLLRAEGLADDDSIDVIAVGDRIANEMPPPDKSVLSGRVVVSTIHKSKGLEYPHVLLLEPRVRSLIGREEEARIYYVAATRAMNTFGLLERGRIGNSRIRRGSYHDRLPGGLGLFVDGMGEIEETSALFTPEGRPIEIDDLKERQTLLNQYGERENVLVGLPRGAERFWIMVEDGLGAKFPVCATSPELDADIKRLPGAKTSWYEADIDGFATVSFERGDDLAEELLGSARVALVPVLSGQLRPVSLTGD